MNGTDKVLPYFVTPKSGNEAWTEYITDNPGTMSRATFYNKVQLLVTRGELKKIRYGVYERTNQAGDFWDYLRQFSAWTQNGDSNRLSIQYVRMVMIDNDLPRFVNELRKVLDELKFLEVADYLRTWYETPKLAQSHLEMFFAMMDPDGSSRAALIQSVQE